MKKSQENSVSPLTKVLINKIHAGRKQDSKFWQSEFANGGANSHTDQIAIGKPEGLDEALSEKRKRKYLFNGICLTICMLFLVVAIQPDWFSSLSYKSMYSTISELFPEKSENRIQIGVNQNRFSKSERKKNLIPSDSQDYQYTEEQIQEAQDKILREKKAQNWLTQEEIDQILTKEPVQQIEQSIDSSTRKIPTRIVFEIELLSGGVVLTDNAVITDDKVIYSSPKGLKIAINKSEIKSMKKLKVTR